MDDAALRVDAAVRPGLHDPMPEASVRQADVSVAMAVYNGGAFLAAQLESLRTQTRLPCELVITDDGSSDDTAAIVARFALTAPFPVIYVCNPTRLGFQDNFLKAAGLCSGRYIAFCDQDDVWLPHKLETCRRVLDRSEALLVAHGAWVTDAQLRPLAHLRQGIVRDRILPALSHLALPGMAYGFSLVFRREVLGWVDPALRPKVPGEGERVLYHDVWVYLLAGAFGAIAHIAEPLVLYRQHGQNALGAKRQGWMERLRQHSAVPVATYLKNAVYARQCALAFASAEGAVEARARTARLFHETIASHLEARARFYQASRWQARYVQLWQMWRLGGYRSRSRAGLGFPALLKDVVFGLCTVAVQKTEI